MEFRYQGGFLPDVLGGVYGAAVHKTDWRLRLVTLLAEDGSWNAKHSLARNIARGRAGRPMGSVSPQPIYCGDLVEDYNT